MIRGGGDEGWWTFQTIDIQPERIEGRISLNFANKPKVVINRRTGDIDIGGVGIAFSGVCQKVEKDAPVKF